MTKIKNISDGTTSKRIRETRLSQCVKQAMFVTAFAASSYAPITFAAEDEPKATEEKLLITGSRIRRDEFSSASPIQILSTEDAKKSGINSLADMLLRMSLTNGQQFDTTFNSNSGNSNATEAPPVGGVGSTNVGLRGLGPERTLILINGRRLGASGVRGAPSQPDISMIPFEMVERVEVLSDSASAIYGADAVAGVVNVILKEEIEGSQFTATVSSPMDDGGLTKQFSFTTGSSSERSTFVFGAEFYDRERIATGDRMDCVLGQYRDTSSGDIYSYCRLGFPDNTAIAFDGDLNSPNGSAWIHFTPGQSDLTNPLSGNPIDNWSSAFNLPAANNFPCYSTGADCTLGVSTATLNGRRAINPFYNDQKERLRADLVQPVTRFSMVARGTYEPEWGSDYNAEIYYETAYLHRHLTNTPSAEQLFVIQPHLIPMENAQGNLLQNPDGSLQLFQNPLNPFGSTVLNVVTFDQLNQTRDVELDHYRAVAGIQGEFSGEWASAKGWVWDVSATYDRGAGVQDQPIINEDRMALALETQRLDANGNVICGYSIPQNQGQGFLTPTECVPFDVWNPRLYNNQGSLSGSLSDAEAAYMIGDRVNHTVVEQKMFQAFVGGELFDFESGGAASVALGAEVRYDRISSRADMLSATGGNAAENPSTEGRTTGSRDVTEFYAEVNLPILEGAAGADLLEIDLAARTTDESNFGSQNTERVRITYAPIDWITLSAAYGTSFRAPNLREQFLGDQFGGVGGGADPCNVNNAGQAGWDGVTYNASADTRSAQVLANCIQQGADPTVLGSLGTTTIPVRIGGNVSDLQPETSEQTTITLKMAPVQGADYNFDFALTYFDIDIEDTIQSIPAATILNRCLSDAPNLESPFCDRIIRPTNSSVPAQNFPTSVDGSFVNIGQETSKGYDLNTRFSAKFDDMSLIWATQFTFQEERASRTFDEDPLLDVVGEFGTPEKRFLNTLSLSHGDFQYTLTSRFIDETHIGVVDDINAQCYVPFNNNTIVGSPQVVLVCEAESQWLHDISASWTPSTDFAVTVGVSNFLDETPPLVHTAAGSNRGGRVVSSGYDQVGRSLFANLTYKF